MLTRLKVRRVPRRIYDKDDPFLSALMGEHYWIINMELEEVLKFQISLEIVDVIWDKLHEDTQIFL